MISISGSRPTMQSLGAAEARLPAHRRMRVITALAAVFLGCFLVAGVGFAGPQALHEAAHDARHAMGFPCH